MRSSTGAAKDTAARVAHPPVNRPVLIFDGDCGFCRRWAERGRRWLGRRVDFASSQEVGPSYPEIAPEAFERGVQFIQTDGRVYSNAEAAFRALSTLPAWRWTHWVYRVVPGVRPATEACYRVVADNRRFFSRLDRWFIGPEPFPPGFRSTRWLFLRVLALIYLGAFLSFWVQAEGLVGSGGILPMDQTLPAIADQLAGVGESAPSRWAAVPTIFWWNAGDGCLHAVCAGGVAVSLLTCAGVLQPTGFFLLWAGYLSLVTVGGVFMSYQWDVLLLEAGFLAIFCAPWQLWPSRRREAPPSLVLVWLYRWLSFRLLLGSGLVKISSGDPSWWPDLTALSVHYETQPLPNPLAWFAHQGPHGYHRFETASVLGLELLVPFLVFAPRRVRRWGGAVMILLQVFILLTGNFAFFNVLTMALCLWWFDDGVFPPRLRAAWAPHGGAEVRSASWTAAVRRSAAVLRVGLAMVVVSVSGFVLRSQVERFAARFGGDGGAPWPAWARTWHDAIRPFGVVGGYGLFAVMTSERPEIVIEGSRDGREWRAYEFPWKPGALDRRPPQVAPHQPRLDWQMWFAALGSVEQPRTRSWFMPFLRRLLEGSPEVLRLLAHNPFPDAPPRWVRAVVYEYRFTDPAVRRESGAWWTRSGERLYCPPLRLSEGDGNPRE